jgi:hypothetical protein
MSSVRLGWASAEVKDAKLTVALDGELPRGWKQSFETTVKLLGNGEWGQVKITKGAVQVSDVTPGTEDKLRHHLEGIVAQANAAHEARERAARQEEDGGDEDDRASGPDAEMTERFRSFEADEEEDSDGEQ